MSLIALGCQASAPAAAPIFSAPHDDGRTNARPTAEEILQRARERRSALDVGPPASAAPSLAHVLPAAEAPEVVRFGDSDVGHWDSGALPSFVDPAAYCQEQANLRLEQARAGETPVAELSQPSCRVVPLPFRFVADETFLSLRALEVFDGGARRTTLLLETKRGFTALPVEWNVESLEPTECPGATIEVGVELGRVDAGVLVIASLVERTAYDNFSFDLPSPVGLTRRVTVARVFDDGVFARTYDPLEALGWKAQPARAWAAWEHLPWFGSKPIVVDAAGALSIPGQRGARAR